ncbi:MAG: PDZ domain-containing protein [Myxococcales bacterium]|nr:PDZ domain-containing protein [Myxococcales bacterium]
MTARTLPIVFCLCALGARPVAAQAAAVPVAPPAPAQTLPDKLWSESQPATAGITADTPVTMGAFSKLAKLLSPAVVNISVTAIPGGRESGDVFGRPVVRGEGTGFFIHPDGLALTNHHVVESAVDITVRTAGDRIFRARVIGRDPRTDLALLKVDVDGPVAIAPLGDSAKVQIGEWVVAIGNPFGLSHTVTAGIVSAVGRSDVHPQGRPMYASFIQTDASINPGNSGGPLVNTRGEVIGINTAIRGDGQGIGFAIPSNMAKKLIPQLARGRIERSFLGVGVRDVSPERARGLKLDKVVGAEVVEVLPGSPAELGGMRAGDVILAFDGTPLRTSSDLPWLAASAGVRAKVPVEVYREGKSLRLAVELRALPRQFGGDEEPEPAGAAEAPTPVPTAPSTVRGMLSLPGLGLSAVDLTAALRQRFQLAAEAGALVISIDRGGPADQVGLRVGDVIVRSGTHAISDVQALDQLDHDYRAGDIVPLLVQRGRGQFYATPRKTR